MAKYVNKTQKEFIIFSLIGGVMTLLSFGLLALFVEILKWNYVLANVISYIIVVIISYFANAKLTFNHEIKDTKKEIKNIINFCIMKLIFLGLDTILLYGMVDKLKVNLYISKVILTIVLTIGSYIFSKKIINDKENI